MHLLAQTIVTTDSTTDVACFLYVLGISIAIPLLIIWMRQILALMKMTDDQFPGKYDKALWLIVVFFGGILGAFIFCYSRPTKKVVSDFEKDLDDIVASRPDNTDPDNNTETKPK